jgi:hypothetical protein
MTRVAAASLCALLAAGCGATGGAVRAPSGAVGPTPAEERARTTELAQAEDSAIGWMAAADPRLAARANAVAPPEVLSRVGMDAVMAEDTEGAVRGTSLNLFAFRARAHALEEAAKALAAFTGTLPDVAPLGSALARPRLERELLERVLVEERARLEDESKLGDASGELLRGVVATWTQPERPQEVVDRDAWIGKHLLEVRDSLRDPARRSGPADLDLALYALERLLAPLQYPRGTSALVQVRLAMDADMRAVPRLRDAATVERGVKLHLGLEVDPASLPARLAKLEGRLRDDAERALGSGEVDGRRAVEGRARELLLVERACPPVADSRVRAMGPPPERALACGVLRVLSEEDRATALVVLHDDVVLAQAAVVASPAVRTRLLSHVDDDAVDSLTRLARERPVVVLGGALAAELLYAGGDLDARLAAWRALGEAPLDVVARELGAVSAAAPPPAAPPRACPPPCTSAP